MTFRLTIALMLLASMLSGQQWSGAKSMIRLRIQAGGLRNGVPDRIAFVFVNRGDQELRMPAVSPCIRGRYNGTIKLILQFSPLRPQTSGVGGGCGVGQDHVPILEEAKSWKIVPPHGAFTISYTRSELFVNQEAPGVYLFSGEYDPPQLTAEDMRALEKANIVFPRESLVSEQLRFTRPE